MTSIPQVGGRYELYLDMPAVFTYAGAALPKERGLYVLVPARDIETE